MGSKRLKAIAVRGSKRVAVARPKEFVAATQQLRRAIAQNRFYPDVHHYGLTKVHDKEMRFSYDIIGETFEGPEWESISEVEFQKKHLHNRVGCFACQKVCAYGAVEEKEIRDRQEKMVEMQSLRPSKRSQKNSSRTKMH